VSEAAAKEAMQQASSDAVDDDSRDFIVGSPRQ
jgi:hypothetical protein